MRKPSPFFWALLAGALVIVAAFAPVLWQMHSPPANPAPADGALPAPWQIERNADGTVLAFGLRLPGSTLADAQARWVEELQVALIAKRGQPAALEAYVERYVGGGVEGKLVLASDADAQVVQRWQDRSLKREIIDADAQRWRLHPDDRAEALRTHVAGLSFLPANRLDEAALQARFGQPAERRPGEGSTQHWLYPAQGLAIAWDADSGRSLVQLVASADFERRLRAPLAAASSPAR
jgi:hypothetical protein